MIFALTSLLIYWTLAEQPDPEVLDVDVMNRPENDTIDEGGTMEEPWVRSAILDLAYYIRSHKFNEYDRRYKTKKTGVPSYYKAFPDPPLRSFHWEAAQFCSKSLIDCLQYTKDYLSKIKFNRELDPIYKIKKKKWTFTKNKTEIEAADKICKAMYTKDFETAEPFSGPLQRFQWRTTISYFMCKYTLQEELLLSAFGEPCDNYAMCLWTKNTISNGDPRGDDRQPFACAKYSFCPDKCCPEKTINITDECLTLEQNPCKESRNRTCLLDGKMNLDVKELSLNHWNVTCSCDEDGYVWDSRYGICVDIDECEENVHTCNNQNETCLNLRGAFECVCSFGFRRHGDDGTCTHIEQWEEIIASFEMSNTWNNSFFKPFEEKKISGGDKLTSMRLTCAILIVFLHFLEM